MFTDFRSKIRNLVYNLGRNVTELVSDTFDEVEFVLRDYERLKEFDNKLREIMSFAEPKRRMDFEIEGYFKLVVYDNLLMVSKMKKDGSFYVKLIFFNL